MLFVDLKPWLITQKRGCVRCVASCCGVLPGNDRENKGTVKGVNNEGIRNDDEVTGDKEQSASRRA